VAYSEHTLACISCGASLTSDGDDSIIHGEGVCQPLIPTPQFIENSPGPMQSYSPERLRLQGRIKEIGSKSPIYARFLGSNPHPHQSSLSAYQERFPPSPPSPEGEAGWEAAVNKRHNHAGMQMFSVLHGVQEKSYNSSPIQRRGDGSPPAFADEQQRQLEKEKNKTHLAILKQQMIEEERRKEIVRKEKLDGREYLTPSPQQPHLPRDLASSSHSPSHSPTFSFSSATGRHRNGSPSRSPQRAIQDLQQMQHVMSEMVPPPGLEEVPLPLQLQLPPLLPSRTETVNIDRGASVRDRERNRDRGMQGDNREGGGGGGRPEYWEAGLADKYLYAQTVKEQRQRRIIQHIADRRAEFQQEEQAMMGGRSMLRYWDQPSAHPARRQQLAAEAAYSSQQMSSAERRLAIEDLRQQNDLLMASIESHRLELERLRREAPN